MPAVKAARPNDIFAREEWKALTSVSRWHGLWLSLHAWLMVALVTGGTALLWQWHWLAGLVATPLALVLVGGRQLGLSILMHEGAHGLLGSGGGSRRVGEAKLYSSTTRAVSL